jgi:hypothetical protein
LNWERNSALWVKWLKLWRRHSLGENEGQPFSKTSVVGGGMQTDWLCN